MTSTKHFSDLVARLREEHKDVLSVNQADREKRDAAAEADAEERWLRKRRFLKANEHAEREQYRAPLRYRQKQREQRKQQHLDDFRATVGRRHAECTLDGYQAETAEQKKALELVTRYSDSIIENITNGVNVLAFGSVGTGKTHYLISLAKKAIRTGFTFEWKSGPALWSELIKAMKEDAEDVALQRLIDAGVFILDDVFGASDTLSDYKRNHLFHVLDARNREMRPTWISVNLPNRDALEAAMGKATVDRLCGGAMRLCMAWRSHRDRQKWGEMETSSERNGAAQ